MTDEMHVVRSEHDGRKQFGFVTKFFWQSIRVDVFDQLVSCGRRDLSDVGESYGIIHLFLRIGEDDVDRLVGKEISRYS